MWRLEINGGAVREGGGCELNDLLNLEKISANPGFEPSQTVSSNPLTSRPIHRSTLHISLGPR